MKKKLDIKALVSQDTLNDELEYERALVAERQLKLLADEDAQYLLWRKALRQLIHEYEKKEWSEISKLDDRKIKESDEAEMEAEAERVFLLERKNLIRSRLQELQLNQGDLCALLGHRSKTHFSELMNGLKPFTIRDIVILHRLLGLDIRQLVPTTLSLSEQTKIKRVIVQLKKPRLQLKKEKLILKSPRQR